MTKYFILENDEKNVMPRVINWYEQINPRYLCMEKYSRLPKRVILDMKLGRNFVYTDFITTPFLMVSKEAWQVISTYSDMPFICAVLFDVEGEGQALYYIPVLPRVKSLEKEDIGKHVLFKLDNTMENKIYIRIDLAESLLERDSIGICLKKAFVLE